MFLKWKGHAFISNDLFLSSETLKIIRHKSIYPCNIGSVNWQILKILSFCLIFRQIKHTSMTVENVNNQINDSISMIFIRKESFFCHI